MEGVIIGGGLLVLVIIAGLVAMGLCIRHKRRYEETTPSNINKIGRGFFFNYSMKFIFH